MDARLEAERRRLERVLSIRIELSPGLDMGRTWDWDERARVLRVQDAATLEAMARAREPHAPSL